jgi:hypothetical protein
LSHAPAASGGRRSGRVRTCTARHVRRGRRGPRRAVNLSIGLLSWSRRSPYEGHRYPFRRIYYRSPWRGGRPAADHPIPSPGPGWGSTLYGGKSTPAPRGRALGTVLLPPPATGLFWLKPGKPSCPECTNNLEDLSIGPATLHERLNEMARGRAVATPLFFSART